MRATETNRRRSALLGAGMVMAAGIMAQSATAAENMRFHGTLVAEPCVIQPGDEDIPLDFGTIVDKYLYLNTRSHSQTFALHLTECDLSLGNTVAITFTGTENAKLPGLLALDAGSLASGIGIGLEDSSGKALPLNRASDKFRLNAGNTTLTLQAYVQGEPEAIQTKSIGRGTFSAVATFTLEYE